MRAFLSLIFLLGCLLTGVAFGADSVKQAPPNVIIFLVDDIGYPDLVCLGNPRSKTPSLDRLYKESVRFTDFHVTPMCTPTRSQLLTGRHCLDNEASMVTCGRTMPRTDFPMMSDVFKASGYATGMFGKWHLGSNHPWLPMDRGFDEVLSMPGSSLGTARDYWNNNGFDCTVLHNGVRKKYPGYITDVWNDEAMKWMAEQQKVGKPFFCYLPSNLVHGPEFVEDERQQVYRNKGYGETLSRIYAALERYDGIYGRVDAFLERSGLKENTVVIFFGDNGSSDVMTGVYNGGMRGYKKSLYDGGHRVQCFVRWPVGGWNGGRDFAPMTEVRDLFPTLMEACSLKSSKDLKLDGTSLAKGLLGKPMPELDDRTLVVQYGHYQEKKPVAGAVSEGHVTGPKYGDAAVLWKQWRWVQGKELYDIHADPGQKTNVAEQHPEIASRLTSFYDQWWKQIAPDQRPLQAIPIGKDANPVQLDIGEWDGVWVDFSNAIRTGERVNGVWHLQVMREGRYTFTLRRWPEELGLPMRATAPQGPWPYAACKALPIAKVRIQIQGQTALADVTEDADAVRITLTLKAERTELKTSFIDAQGEVLCGAYYTDVQLEEVIRKIEPLSVRGVNYYPRGTPWSKMWTETSTEVWEQDMAAAAKLGVNTVRTFLIFSPNDVANGLATEDGTPTPAYHEKIQRLLAAGWKHGIRFVLCFEFSPHILKAPDAVQRWQRAMRSIAFPLRDDGRVLMWDLMNEPESDEKWTEPAKAYLRGAMVFIKEIDPNHLTTIGITYRTDRLQEIGLPDVLQYHEYGTGRKMTVQSGLERARKTINNQRLNQTERPLIIGEFGACTARDAQHGTGPELAPKLNEATGTEDDQVKIYAVALEAVKQERIGGAIAWCLYDYPINNPNESHFGLIRTDGTLKPAAKVLRDAFNAWGK